MQSELNEQKQIQTNDKVKLFFRRYCLYSAPWKDWYSNGKRLLIIYIIIIGNTWKRVKGAKTNSNKW